MAFDVTHLKFLLTPGRKEIKFLRQTLTSNISKKNYHCCTLWKVSRNVLIFSLIDATTEIHKFFPCQCHHRNVFIFPLLMSPQKCVHFSLVDVTTEMCSFFKFLSCGCHHRNVFIFPLSMSPQKCVDIFPHQCHHRNVFIFPLHQNVPATLLGPSVTMDVTRTQAFADASVMLLAETATNAM